MKDKIFGKVYVVGDNIDTDQIIPAKFLVFNTHSPDERRLYGKFAMSGVPEEKSGLPTGGIRFIKDGEFESEFKIIIAGKNFGCGSSREHAPFALQVAGVTAVVAQSYARIFYRNCVDGAFVIPFESVENIFERFVTGEEVEIDIREKVIRRLSTDETFELRSLGDAADIIEAGGLFAYARKIGMIKPMEIQ